MFQIGTRSSKGPLRVEPKYEPEGDYDAPEERKIDRPHELGWFERLNDSDGKGGRLGEMAPGRIIP